MKKNRINAFTLVEMLIVIVIIGILIAALMPRMQAAQGRARDVSRKTALSQVQSAIVVWQGDNGKWPGMSGDKATSGIGISEIKEDLMTAGMNSVPVDPLQQNVSGLGDSETTSGDYAYMVLPRNGTQNGGFVLMAKTEVPGGSNWIYCGPGHGQDIDHGKISSAVDINEIKLCTSMVKTDDLTSCEISDGVCIYNKEEQLRYIVLY